MLGGRKQIRSETTFLAYTIKMDETFHQSSNAIIRAWLTRAGLYNKGPLQERCSGHYKYIYIYRGCSSGRFRGEGDLLRPSAGEGTFCGRDSLGLRRVPPLLGGLKQIRSETISFSNLFLDGSATSFRGEEILKVGKSNFRSGQSFDVCRTVRAESS